MIDLEQRWLNSEDNPGALAEILADDFIHVLPSGLITKTEQLEYMRTHSFRQSQTKKHFEHLNVRTFGDAGVVDGVVVAISDDGKVRKTVFSDVFAYRHGSWRAVNAQECSLSLVIGSATSPSDTSRQRRIASPQHS